MSFEQLKIGFVGAGNMNSAIIGGLIESGFSAAQIMASDPSVENLAALKLQYAIHTTTDNSQTATFADMVVLGVKPNYVASVCQEITAAIGSAILISVAAGITTTQISAALGRVEGIVRVMPNTPCLYNTGMVGLFADQQISQAVRDDVNQIFNTLAETEWFENEALMDMVTALSGSGPAYFFHFAEAMVETAEAAGMNALQAKHLVTQTMLGAATMLKESPHSAAELREAVTSPGGTTAAALETMYKHNLADILSEAIRAAECRGKEMAKENDIK